MRGSPRQTSTAVGCSALWQVLHGFSFHSIVRLSHVSDIHSGDYAPLMGASVGLFRGFTKMVAAGTLCLTVAVFPVDDCKRCTQHRLCSAGS